MGTYIKGLLGLGAACSGIQLLRSEPFSRMEDIRYRRSQDPVTIDLSTIKGESGGLVHVHLLGFAQYSNLSPASVARSIKSLQPHAIAVSAAPEDLTALQTVYALLKPVGLDPQRMATEGLAILKRSRLREDPCIVQMAGLVPGYAAALAVGQAAELGLPCQALDHRRFQQAASPVTAGYNETMVEILKRSVGYDVYGRVSEEFSAVPALIPGVLSSLFDEQDWEALAQTLKKDDPAAYELRHRQRHQYMADRTLVIAREVRATGAVPTEEPVRVLAVVTDPHVSELREALLSSATTMTIVDAPPGQKKSNAGIRARLGKAIFG